MKRKIKKVVSEKVPKNVKKAFAVATYLSVVIRDYDMITKHEFSVLNRQSTHAIRVFSAKVGAKACWDISDKFGDFWEQFYKDGNNKLDKDVAPILIELLCMIIPPKDFSVFFATPAYCRDRHTHMDKFTDIAKATLILDESLNSFLGTKAYTLQKPKAIVVKVKKERDKGKKSAKVGGAKKNINRMLKNKKAKESKAKNMATLRERIAAARALKSSNDAQG